jgi:hypothetical protein
MALRPRYGERVGETLGLLESENTGIRSSHSSSWDHLELCVGHMRPSKNAFEQGDCFARVNRVLADWAEGSISSRDLPEFLSQMLECGIAAGSNPPSFEALEAFFDA